MPFCWFVVLMMCMWSLLNIFFLKSKVLQMVPSSQNLSAFCGLPVTPALWTVARNCLPAPGVLLDFSKFLYHLSSCGIKTYECPWGYSYCNFNHMWTSKFRYQGSHSSVNIFYSPMWKNWKGIIAIYLGDIQKASEKEKLSIISTGKCSGPSRSVNLE